MIEDVVINGMIEEVIVKLWIVTLNMERERFGKGAAA
jgi:hypothetical protein